MVGALDTAGETCVGAAVPTMADWGPPMAAGVLCDRVAAPLLACCLAAARRAENR